MSDPKTKKYFSTQILGVTPQAMAKIEHRLTMVKVKGKKILHVDLHGKNTLQYLAERDIKIKEAQPEKPTPPKKPKVLGNNPTGKKSPDNSNNNSDDDDPTEETKLDLEKKKIKEQTETSRIKNEILRGSLIDKSLVVSIFAKIYAIDTNQFKTLNFSAGPKISGIYVESYQDNTDQILKHLGKEDDHELKNEINKIQNAGEPIRIKKMTEVLEDSIGKILKNIQNDLDFDLDSREKETQ